MSEPISAADFESLPDRSIVVLFDNAEVALDVVEIRTLSPTPFRSAPFTVTLRHNGATRHAPQGTYTFRHPVKGALELFTSPRGPDGKGMCYEIIFN